MIRFRLVRSKDGWLKNKCGQYLDEGTPMVGCKYCRHQCPHNKGTIKFLFWDFIVCKWRGE